MADEQGASRGVSGRALRQRAKNVPWQEIRRIGATFAARKGNFLDAFRQRSEFLLFLPIVSISLSLFINYIFV